MITTSPDLRLPVTQLQYIHTLAYNMISKQLPSFQMSLEGKKGTPPPTRLSHSRLSFPFPPESLDADVGHIDVVQENGSGADGLHPEQGRQ